MLSFNEINKEENSFSEDLKLFLSKRNSTSSEVASKVSTIISEIRHRGDDALNDSAIMLVQNLGLSGLILRSLISLKNELEKIEK